MNIFQKAMMDSSSPLWDCVDRDFFDQEVIHQVVHFFYEYLTGSGVPEKVKELWVSWGGITKHAYVCVHV